MGRFDIHKGVSGKVGPVATYTLKGSSDKVYRK